jgi:hypothetical protein
MKQRIAEFNLAAQRECVGVGRTCWRPTAEDCTPTSQSSVTRTFKIREAMSFSVRAEFVNIFNRTVL